MGLVVAVCAILVALAWRASGSDIYLSPSHYPWSLASYPSLAKVAEPLTVHSRTGATLVGRFFPGRDRATIVLSHGYGSDETEMLPVANSLHAAGFTVVIYNERGRDGSTGQSTWGALETQDLRAVIAAVVRHPDVNRNEVGEFGFSIGADISILEAAHDPRIKAVVADGSWPSLSWYMKPRLVDVIFHPTSLFSPLALKIVELRTGAHLDHVNPGAVIAQLSPRPILLMDGVDDTDVTPRGSTINYSLARAPRELWLVPGETHEGTVFPGGGATWSRIPTFFAHILLPVRR
jgi:cephalosporin-C deacetylase-like acetyl esterase